MPSDPSFSPSCPVKTSGSHWADAAEYVRRHALFRWIQHVTAAVGPERDEDPLGLVQRNDRVRPPVVRRCLKIDLAVVNVRGTRRSLIER